MVALKFAKLACVPFRYSAMPSPYTLYIANKVYSSWSLRPWVLMQELAIAFQEKLVPLSTGSSWDSYRQFSPQGRVPCLHER
jgi:glutathione S-transferase